VSRRGVDLLGAELDYWGHGTPVNGIVAGGWPGRHGMTGIAPDAELVHFINDYVGEPPFLVPIEAGLAWTRDEGADIVLIEDGEWVWEYMDGSSNVELMINELCADEGQIFVVPAGNLATGNMHTSFESGAGAVLHATTAHIFWIDFLWTAPAALAVTVTPPGGAPVALPGDGSLLVTQGYRIYSLLSESDRGTRRFDIRLASDPEGDYLFGTGSSPSRAGDRHARLLRRRRLGLDLQLELAVHRSEKHGELARHRGLGHQRGCLQSPQ